MIRLKNIIAGEINKKNFDSTVVLQSPLYEIDRKIEPLCEKYTRELIVVSQTGDYESGPFEIPNNVYRFYCQGINFFHKKIRCIPLGINEIQDEAISKIQIKEKTELAFRNFAIHTHPSRRTWAENQCKKKCFITNIEYDKGLQNRTLMDLYEEISKYKFGISPVGNGLDCYRTWEYLYLGIIPIVYDIPMNRYFSKEVPMTLVSSYEELTETMLNKEYNRIQNTKWNWDFLTQDYHEGLILRDIENLTKRNSLV